jgi:ppGpp synthetase/RelA/SpoT-type nucleotidyltranferase
MKKRKESPVKEELSSDDAWLSSPSVVRTFLENRPAYEQLCSEVAYTIGKAVERENIPIAHVTHRAKELSSFLEKVERKSIHYPFEEITDFAGARVVCYYADDVARVAAIVESHFNVKQKEDKTEEAGVDRFGYGGVHYLVQLGDNVAGPRYDDLKSKLCEVQLRTVMQDAWAVVSHHLLYKKESDMPSLLKRGVNALAGALDSADIGFLSLRNERDIYLGSVKESITKAGLSEVEVNLDSLSELLIASFGEDAVVDVPSPRREAAMQLMDRAGIRSLAQVGQLLSDTASGRDWFRSEGPGRRYVEAGLRKVDGFGEIHRAIYIRYPDLRPKSMASAWAEAYDRAASLDKESS